MLEKKLRHSWPTHVEDVWCCSSFIDKLFINLFSHFLWYTLKTITEDLFISFMSSFFISRYRRLKTVHKILLFTCFWDIFGSVERAMNYRNGMKGLVIFTVSWDSWSYSFFQIFTEVRNIWEPDCSNLWLGGKNSYSSILYHDRICKKTFCGVKSF